MGASLAVASSGGAAGMSLDAAGQTLPVKADQTAAHKPLSKRGDAESGAADNVATSGTTTTLRRGHADTSSSSSHTTADGSSTPRWVTPKHALTAISKSGDADDRVGDAAPRWAESSHTNAATSASGDAQPSSLPRQPSSAPLSSDAMDVQSLLGSLSYGRSASAARRPLGESQSSPLIGTGRGTYEPLSSRQQGPPTRTTPVLSNGHSHRSLQSDSSTSFSSVGAAAAAATSTIADVGGTGALSSLSEFGNAMHRWPHATDPAATPRRWASTVSTSVSSVGPPLPEGLDAIKARLDALSSPVETYARRGAEAQHPQHPDASSFAARRIRELEAERSELRTKEAEQLRVVRACLAERDELRRADESRTQACVLLPSVSWVPRCCLGLKGFFIHKRRCSFALFLSSAAQLLLLCVQARTSVSSLGFHWHYRFTNPSLYTVKRNILSKRATLEFK